MQNRKTKRTIVKRTRGKRTRGKRGLRKRNEEARIKDEGNDDQNVERNRRCAGGISCVPGAFNCETKLRQIHLLFRQLSPLLPLADITMMQVLCSANLGCLLSTYATMHSL